MEIFNAAYWLVTGISALVAILSAFNAFSKKNAGDPNAENAIKNWIYTCVFLVIMLVFIRGLNFFH